MRTRENQYVRGDTCCDSSSSRVIVHGRGDMMLMWGGREGSESRQVGDDRVRGTTC